MQDILKELDKRGYIEQTTDDEKLGEFKGLTNPLECITSLELTNTS